MIRIEKYKIALILLVLIITGCAESSFKIAEDSRLPKWFAIPPGMSRQNLAVTLDYYSNKVVFTLLDKNGNKLSEKKGKRYGWYFSPKKLKNPPPGFPEGYPAYEIIIVDGVIDIIEHRKMEPIFYVTDDPAVWNELCPKQKK